MGVFLSTYYVAPSRHAEERSDVGISQRRRESAAVKEVREFREVKEGAERAQPLRKLESLGKLGRAQSLFSLNSLSSLNSLILSLRLPRRAEPSSQ